MKVYNLIIGLILAGIIIILNPKALEGKMVLYYPENIYFGIILIILALIIVFFKRLYDKGIRQ